MWFFSSRMRKVQKAIEKLGMYLVEGALRDYECGNCFLRHAGDDIYELRKKAFHKRALGDIVETHYSCYFTYCYRCDAITDYNANAKKRRQPIRFYEWLSEQEPNLADEKILTEAFDQLTKERKKVMDKLNKVHEVNDKLLGPYRSNGKLLKE